ncbi:MAG: hypothetical protein AAB332_07365, partial [Planctomycetota bacterium]
MVDINSLREGIENLIYVYEEVFWLKECITVGASLLVFLFVWRIVVLEYDKALLLYASAFIGAACIMMGDMEYWSSNDILKLIAPISLFLLAHKKKQESDVMLFIFLVPYFFTSYAFHIYKNFYYGGVSLLTIPFIIFCIALAKQNRALSVFISIAVGILINLIGINCEPGINDILINPALITLAVRGLEFRTKDPRYTGFLKIFWITLICFAFFGSWAFHYAEPILPSILVHLKMYVTTPFFDTGKHLIGNEEVVFWLKECFTVGVSLLVFLFVWRIVVLGYDREILLYVSAFIGAACIMMGDMEYWSSNDILKLIAPISLLLLAHKKKQESDVMLFIFLVPYFFTSYAFHIYKNFYYGGVSLLTIPFIIFCIALAKQNRALSVFISIAVGILINLIGINCEPGINDILINPALITLAVRGLEFRTKDPRYTGFLKIFWITLICFAFFGSWIFHYLEPILPSMLDYLKAHAMAPFFDAVKHLMEICDEVFWLKECITTFISFVIFLIVWGLLRLRFGAGALLVVGTFIGFACIFLDGVNFWSSNDILKLLAPTAVFLLANKKKQDSDIFLYIFLVPYLLTSYEFYRSFPYGAVSVMSHAMILLSIAFVKKNMPLSFITSATVGILINLLGVNASPG